MAYCAIIGRSIKIGGFCTVGVFAGAGCFAAGGSPAQAIPDILMIFTLFCLSCGGGLVALAGGRLLAGGGKAAFLAACLSWFCVLCARFAGVRFGGGKGNLFATPPQKRAHRRKFARLKSGVFPPTRKGKGFSGLAVASAVQCKGNRFCGRVVKKAGFNPPFLLIP